MILTAGGAHQVSGPSQDIRCRPTEATRNAALGAPGWPTSTIRQAYYGTSLSADPTTPPIKLGLSKSRRMGGASDTHRRAGEDE